MKPYSNPYAAGFALGLVLLASFAFAGRGLGASGAFAWVAARVAPLYIDPNGYYDDTELSLVQDFFIRIGAQREKVDVSKIVDRSYVDYALQRLGRW